MSAFFCRIRRMIGLCVGAIALAALSGCGGAPASPATPTAAATFDLTGTIQLQVGQWLPDRTSGNACRGRFLNAGGGTEAIVQDSSGKVAGAGSVITTEITDSSDCNLTVYVRDIRRGSGDGYIVKVGNGTYSFSAAAAAAGPIVLIEES